MDTAFLIMLILSLAISSSRPIKVGCFVYVAALSTYIILQGSYDYHLLQISLDLAVLSLLYLGRGLIPTILRAFVLLNIFLHITDGVLVHFANNSWQVDTYNFIVTTSYAIQTSLLFMVSITDRIMAIKRANKEIIKNVWVARVSATS